MDRCRDLLLQIETGGYDGSLARLYGPKKPERARERAEKLVWALRSTWGLRGGEPALFSAPGRTELGGNHTDHQRGRVLCAAVGRDMLCCAAPNTKGQIRISSGGFGQVIVPVDELAPAEAERGTAAALVRGTADYIAALGYPPAGFDACVDSAVPVGSGLSSSAAFEVLLARVMNELWCGGALDALTMARAGQYAENEYFGKPCGLMDQAASALGGAAMIDFADPDEPAVTPVEFDPERYGYSLCIVGTGSCHADLTADYAAIPQEMRAAAALLGGEVLSQTDEGSLMAALPVLREKLGDRAALRALHFWGEQARVSAQTDALRRGDFEGYLALVRASGRSSALLLQNVFSPAAPRSQPVTLALALGERLLEGRGAVRVHGGGFGGTMQAYVPAEALGAFRAGMDAVFGQGALQVMAPRPVGACRLTADE